MEKKGFIPMEYCKPFEVNYLMTNEMHKCHKANHMFKLKSTVMFALKFNGPVENEIQCVR